MPKISIFGIYYHYYHYGTAVHNLLAEAAYWWLVLVALWRSLKNWGSYNKATSSNHIKSTKHCWTTFWPTKAWHQNNHQQTIENLYFSCMTPTLLENSPLKMSQISVGFYEKKVQRKYTTQYTTLYFCHSHFTSTHRICEIISLFKQARKWHTRVSISFWH